MGRVTDADVERWAKAHDRLPEEAGFHAQDGLIVRRLDDGSVRVVVIAYKRVRGSALDEHGRAVHDVVGTMQEMIFSTILTPESWASIVSSVCARGETEGTWDEARRFHMNTH